MRNNLRNLARAVSVSAVGWFFTHLGQIWTWCERIIGFASGATQGDTEKAVENTMNRWSQIPFLGSQNVEAVASYLFVAMAAMWVGLWLKQRFFASRLLVLPVSAEEPATTGLSSRPLQAIAVATEAKKLIARLRKFQKDSRVKATDLSQADQWRYEVGAFLGKSLGESAKASFFRECNYAGSTNPLDMQKIRTVLGCGVAWLDAQILHLETNGIPIPGHAEQPKEIDAVAVHKELVLSDLKERYEACPIGNENGSAAVRWNNDLAAYLRGIFGQAVKNEFGSEGGFNDYDSIEYIDRQLGSGRAWLKAKITDVELNGVPPKPVEVDAWSS